MSDTSRIPASLWNGFSRVRARQAYLNLDLVRNIVFFLFLLRLTRRVLWKIRGRGIFGTIAELYTDARRILFGWFLRLPSVRAKVRRDVDEALGKMENKLVPAGAARYTTLPAQGWSDTDVRNALDSLAELEHTRWEDGRVSGAVYHGEDELLQLQAEAYSKFSVANPIHPDVFPGVRKMEAEVVAMVLGLFNAPAGAAGVTTSGGTDSILMACLSARQKAYAERGVTEPEMILPETAHTAFHKAGQYFKIKVHLVSCPAPTYQVDVKRVARLINPNTVLLVGSAPNFPHGIIDDISALGRLAQRKKLPLHVDCCLGSFMVAMLERSGFETTPFDFRVRGVTSISVDTHKYGFAPKGNSTLLYRTAALRGYQYFVSPDWSGGVYASPGAAGSRPGALIAGCWASMMSMGEAGYLDACVRIVGAAHKLAEHIVASPVLSPEIEVMGRPLVSVVAFRARQKKSSSVAAPDTPIDIYALADNMSARGWHLNALQNPPAIHVAFTLPVSKALDNLIADLEAAVEEEREKARVQAVERAAANGGKAVKAPQSTGNAVALYGVAGSLPNKSVVVDLATGFLDLLYKA